MKTPNRSLLTCLAACVGAFGVHAADLTWDADTVTTGAQDGAGSWNSSANNWWDGAENVTWNNATPDNAIFGAGSGAAGTITISSSTTNTVGNITFNTPGSLGYAIAGSSSTTSKLNLSAGSVITVAGGVSATNNAVTSGAGFIKDGSGLLAIGGSTANIFTGATVVTNGTLVLKKSDNIVAIPGDLIVAAGASVVVQNKAQLASTANLTVNGTFDTGSKILFVNTMVVDNNAQILGASSSVAITNTTLYDLRSGSIAPNLAGTAGLTKTTGGTVSLSNGGGADTFTGPVLVSAGILQLSHSGTGNGLPGVVTTITNTGTIQLLHDTEFNTNATLIVAGGTFELLAHNDTVGALILDNGGNILNGGNTSKTLTVNTNLDFRNGVCASKLGGAGVMVKSTAATVTLTMDNANSGGTLISAGILQLGDGSVTNRGQFGTGPVTNNAIVVLNHSGAFTLANAISGTGSVTNLGGSPSFTGASTYAGDTTVSGGTLFVNNTTGSGTGSGTVRIQSGAGLGGAGIIGGAVNIQSGGALVPGNNGFGTLSVNGPLNLDANSSSTFDVNGTGASNDVVALGSSVVYGGTLNITASGTFTPGQQFVLFSGPGAANTGNFASLQSAAPGVTFSFTNGVLTVASVLSSSPTLGVAQSGNSLTFSWSDPSFKLQCQTNGLAANNWVDYPGGATSPVGVTIDPANPGVFFRLSQ